MGFESMGQFEKRAAFVLMAVLLSMAQFNCAFAEGAEVNSGLDDSLVAAETVRIVTAEDLVRLPVTSTDEVITLQQGTVNAPIGGMNGEELHIRGGRLYQTDYFVNGVDFKNRIDGVLTSSISRHALRKFNFFPGGYGVSKGAGGSGYFDMTTFNGADKYSGMVEAFSDNLTGAGHDQNWYTARLDGPIPGLAGGSFFGLIERRWLADRSPSAVTADVLPGSPDRLPDNWLRGWTYHAGVDYRPSSKALLTLRVDGSHDKWKEYWHEFLFESEHTPRYEDKNFGAIGKLDYDFDDKTSMFLAVSFFESERIRGDGVLFDDLDAYLRQDANPRYDYHNLFREGDSIFLSDIDPYFDYEVDEDTFVTFYEPYFENFIHHKSSHTGLQVDLSRRLKDYIVVKTGFDYRRHTVRYYEKLNATYADNRNRINRYGYNIDGSESDLEDFAIEEINGYSVPATGAKHPIELGGYVEGRFTFSDIVARAGLRLDRFDYNSLVLKDIRNPFGLNENLDLEDMVDADVLTQISPRFGIGWQPSEAAHMFFNYGTYYRFPPFQYAYIGWDFFRLRLGGPFTPFASLPLELEKTTLHEVGLTYAVTESFDLSMAFYNKVVERQVQIGMVYGIAPYNYPAYQNIDDGTVKGAELTARISPNQNVSLKLSYTLSQAKGTGSYANSNFEIIWKNPMGVPTQQTPLDYDQRHDIVSYLDIRTGAGEGLVIGNHTPFENMSLGFILQAKSGFAYTPTEPYDAASPNVSVIREPLGPLNSKRQPWQFVIDLKLEKTLSLGQFKLTPFLMVKNLLDRKNINYVYAATGEPDNNGYLTSPEGIARSEDPRTSNNSDLTRGEEFVLKYPLAENNPTHYAAPRQIYLGLRAAF